MLKYPKLNSGQHDDLKLRMANSRFYCVYILTNKLNKVLYIGVINDLARRIFEHKNKLAEGFTRKYNLSKLVYYEVTNDVESAIRREKQLKNWHRHWKLNLINQFNSEWNDLSEEFLQDAETSLPQRDSESSSE
jgi:putative endonuclease